MLEGTVIVKADNECILFHTKSSQKLQLPMVTPASPSSEEFIYSSEAVISAGRSARSKRFLLSDLTTHDTHASHRMPKANI